ncbi:hypothetical protein [Streptomyces sp. V1I6]|uniref:hypothetical protein n=1 Tax=Streptomyces sp. V1I6 TaxID=3042273 RepID=UPI0035939396
MAAMIGSVSMLGAGAASAAGAYGDEGDKAENTNVFVCEQAAEVDNSVDQVGLINIASSASSLQQICSGDDTVASSDAAADAGVDIAITLPPLPLPL